MSAPLNSGRSIAAPRLRHTLLAVAGSVVIGVTLPVLLVGLRIINRAAFNEPERVVENAAGLMIAALIACGPGAVLLSYVLLKGLVKGAENWTLRRTACMGVLCGIPLAFMNFPGYFVMRILRDDTFVPARVELLFAVAGASCGLWIGWLAWSARHAPERIFPRFSLGTLLLIVVLWGSVLTMFQPKDWDGTTLPWENVFHK